jgi:hypothetical protein
VGKVWVVRYFAAVEINGERSIPLVGKLGGLFLDLIVEAPILVNYDDAGVRTFAGGCVEEAVYGFISAFVGDGLAVGGEAGDSEKKKDDQQGDHSHRGLPCRGVRL